MSKWEVKDKSITTGNRILWKDGSYICEVRAQEDANFIVKACNSHEELVVVVKNINGVLGNFNQVNIQRGSLLHEQIKQAIKNAE